MIDFDELIDLLPDLTDDVIQHADQFEIDLSDLDELSSFLAQIRPNSSWGSLSIEVEQTY